MMKTPAGTGDPTFVDGGAPTSRNARPADKRVSTALSCLARSGPSYRGRADL